MTSPIRKLKRLTTLLVAFVTSATAWLPSAPGAVWPTEPERIAKQLNASDANQRRSAAHDLLQLPTALAAPLVLQALSDSDPQVRLDAASAALVHRVVGAGPLVLSWLSEPDARLRLAACRVLQPAPLAPAIAALGRVLGDADATVRQAAAKALGHADSADAALALLGHLDDPSPEVRVAVIDSLGRLGDTRAVVPLAGKVQDSTPEVRRAVARGLGALGDAQATSALLLALRDTVMEVRIEALHALGAIADPNTAFAVAPVCDPQNSFPVRRAALSALGKMGGERALSLLIAALPYDDPSANRAPARDALVHAGAASVPILLQTLAAPNTAQTASLAAEALGILRASGAREAIVLAMRKGLLPTDAALRALAHLADRDALPVVLELMDAPTATVRTEAYRAADALLEPRYPSGAAVDPLSIALAKTRLSVDERATIARLLGKTGSPRATPLLVPLLSSSQLPIRIAALDALGMLGDTGQDNALVKALRDTDPVVRAHAGAALARAASEQTLSILFDQLASAEEQDRAALATAVAGALERVRSNGVITHAAALLPLSEGGLRDALIEGLGRNPQPAARKILVQQLESLDAGDRRKAAEALAGRNDSNQGVLRSLLTDIDPSVRANAAWSLGRNPQCEDMASLIHSLSDPSTAVASNAAMGLGRLAAHDDAPRAEAKKALCLGFADARSYVRAAVLSGLRAAGARCDPDGSVERNLVLEDPSYLVRSAAADLLRAVSSGNPLHDKRALSRCRLEDPVGIVASHCSTQAAHVSTWEPITVLVVPDGQTHPAPESPFALVFADHSIRHGVSDRRGAVFERNAPQGVVSLGVAAPFVR